MMGAEQLLPPLIGIRGPMGAGKDTLAAEILAAHPAYRVAKFATKLREAVEIMAGIPPDRTHSAADKAADLSGVEWGIDDFYGRVTRAVHAVCPRQPPRGDALRVVHVHFAEALADLVYDTQTPAPNVAMISNARLRMKPGTTVGRFLQVLGTECFREGIGEHVWVDAVVQPWEDAERPPTVISDARFPNETRAIRRSGGVIVEIRRAAAARDDGRATSHASEQALGGEEADVVIENDGTIDDLRAALAELWPRIVAIAEERAE